MAESRRGDVRGDLYERLLHRLATALDEADSLNHFSREPLRELELRDLTAAELQLIRAYLDRDRNWLRGWHAAAQELAQIERLPAPSQAAASRRPLLRGVSQAEAPSVQLCCALCGGATPWLPGRGVRACASCGSQLFRTCARR